MTNKLTCFTTAIIMIVLFAGCAKEADKFTSKKSLVGTWEWEGTSGGTAFHIHATPASTGKNVDLKITSGGEYFVYTNGALTSKGTYILETQKCIHDNTNKTWINFSSDYDFMVERLDENTLQVSDEGHDGMGSGYKRKS